MSGGIRHQSSPPNGTRGVTWRAALVALAVACLAPVTVGCAEADYMGGSLQEVTIATTMMPASAPVYVAEEHGFFEDAGIEVTIIDESTGRTAVDAVLDGSADYATCAETPVAIAAIQGDPVSVVATIAEVDEAARIVARRDAGIWTGSDLRGKRIGVVPETAAQFFMYVYLPVAGLTIDDVEVVTLAPGDTVAALNSRRVDAVSASPPESALAEQALAANAVVLVERGIYTMSWNLITSEANDRAQNRVTARVLRALIEADEYIASHPDEVAQLAARRTGTPTAWLDRQWRFYRWDVRLDQQLLLTLEDTLDWMMPQTQHPDFLRHIDTDTLRRVAPEHVTLTEPGE